MPRRTRPTKRKKGLTVLLICICTIFIVFEQFVPVLIHSSAFGPSSPSWRSGQTLRYLTFCQKNVQFNWKDFNQVYIHITMFRIRMGSWSTQGINIRVMVGKNDLQNKKIKDFRRAFSFLCNLEVIKKCWIFPTYIFPHFGHKNLVSRSGSGF